MSLIRNKECGEVNDSTSFNDNNCEKELEQSKKKEIFQCTSIILGIIGIVTDVFVVGILPSILGACFGIYGILNYKGRTIKGIIGTTLSLFGIIFFDLLFALIIRNYTIILVNTFIFLLFLFAYIYVLRNHIISNSKTSNYSKEVLQNFTHKTSVPVEMNIQISQPINQKDDAYEANSENIFFKNMDGLKFEKFCADILEKNGYDNVEVTRGSGDQGVDILAEKDKIKYAIQCKFYSHSVGNKAVQEIYTGMRFYRCHVGIIMTNNRFTQSAKDVAKENGIILWDGDILHKFISQNLKYETDDIVSTKDESKIHLTQESQKKLSKSINKQQKNYMGPGMYTVGEDIPPGKYLLICEKNCTGTITIYKSYNDYINENIFLYQNFENSYYIQLRNIGFFIELDGASINRAEIADDIMD